MQSNAALPHSLYKEVLPKKTESVLQDQLVNVCQRGKGGRGSTMKLYHSMNHAIWLLSHMSQDSSDTDLFFSAHILGHSPELFSLLQPFLNHFFGLWITIHLKYM